MSKKNKRHRFTNSINDLHNLTKNNLNNNVKKSEEIIMEINDIKNDMSRYGIGLDVGTGFLVSAKYYNDKISYVPIRDAFYKLEKHLFNETMFNKNKMKYIENNNDVIIVGEDALTFARIRNESASRPLSIGIINPKERASAFVLKEMFTYLIKGHVGKKQEKLVFSIPGPQINNPSFDTTYHSMSLSSLIRQFDCDPVPMNEAFLVVVSELGVEEEITGLGFSFGAGLVNCSFSFKGVNLFEFSIDKSGDFIDKQAADAVGESTSVISYIKETDLDLTADEYNVSSEQRALIFSHRYVLQYTLQEVKKAFTNNNKIKIFEEIPIVISGGTSLPKGFIDLFKKELDNVKLPFKVSDIIHAQDPLKSVAKGALIYANMLEQ